MIIILGTYILSRLGICSFKIVQVASSSVFYFPGEISLFFDKLIGIFFWNFLFFKSANWNSLFAKFLIIKIYL
jgi:hypothetical protein